MKRSSLFTLAVCLLVVGCATSGRDLVFQTSTIDALLAGIYDGDLACGDLLGYGDLGIGTFDALDGEMVLLNGTIYQVRADGKVYRPEHSLGTPFATVCRFKPDVIFEIESESDYPAVQKLIDARAPNQNIFCAVRITGQFKSMHTRSVPRQVRPYPPLAEVTRHQPEFRLENVRGTIVGFRSPAFVKGVNVPGYHLHFISEYRTCGGHILGFELTSGECEIDLLDKYYLRLPGAHTGFAETDLTKDRGEELHEVEMGRGRRAQPDSGH